MKLKNKRILITAGPTRVPIDEVRVLSNIATGETGRLLAQEAARRKAKVTLILGPVSEYGLDKSIKLIHFSYFDELRNKIKKELSLRKYDLVIHSAAVSDFKPKHRIRGKFNSGKGLNLKLVPLPKIIQDIKHFVSASKLITFKLEPAVSDKVLIQRARKALSSFKSNYIVANRLNPYQAFIINRNNKVISVRSKQELANKLLKLI